MNVLHYPLSTSNPRRLKAEETDAFARRVGWVDDIGVISSETTLLQSQELPWCADHELLLAHDAAWGSNAAAWIRGADKLYRLDGTSPPIHALNAQMTPQFTKETVTSYLGFFCFFIHGDEGPFCLVTSVDDFWIPRAIDKNDLADFMAPAICLREDDSGFHVEARVFYSNALFHSNFLVKRDGMVEMIEDEPLKNDFPSKIDMPLKFVRQE